MTEVKESEVGRDIALPTSESLSNGLPNSGLPLAPIRATMASIPPMEPEPSPMPPLLAPYTLGQPLGPTELTILSDLWVSECVRSWKILSESDQSEISSLEDFAQNFSLRPKAGSPIQTELRSLAFSALCQELRRQGRDPSQEPAEALERGIAVLAMDQTLLEEARVRVARRTSVGIQALESLLS